MNDILNDDSTQQEFTRQSMASGHSHSFDTGIASHTSLEAAIVYNHICFWITHNKAKGYNQIDGKTWMYSTHKEISDQFDYLNERQVKLCIEKLLEKGLIVKAYHHENKFDRTAWYALHDESSLDFSKKLFEKTKMSNAEDINVQSKEHKCLMYNKEKDKKTDKKQDTHPNPQNSELPNGSEVVGSSSFPSKVKKPKGSEKVDILKDKHLDHILLSKEEHTKLLELHGEKSLLWMMEILNAYLGSKGDKYKSHYPLMCKGGWVCKRLEEEKVKSPTLAPAGSYQRRGKLAISADARAEVTQRPQMKTDHISDQELEEFLARAKTSKEKSK